MPSRYYGRCTRRSCLIAALVAIGIASWWQPYQRMYDGGYFCAMNAVPSGARVRVVAGRRHQTCTVIGTGPFIPGRVIDVSPLVRDDLDLLRTGVMKVRVYCIRRCP